MAMNRRKFLKTSALGTLSFAIPSFTTVRFLFAIRYFGALSLCWVPSSRSAVCFLDVGVCIASCPKRAGGVDVSLPNLLSSCRPEVPGRNLFKTESVFSFVISFVVVVSLEIVRVALNDWNLAT